MSVERRGPAVRNSSDNTGGRGGMIKTPIDLQDLRRKIYTKAKADTAWRFWGLYVHVGKLETLREAYLLAKKNNGAPGIDGVTFEAIEAGGVEAFLVQLRAVWSPADEATPLPPRALELGAAWRQICESTEDRPQLADPLQIAEALGASKGAW